MLHMLCVFFAYVSCIFSMCYAYSLYILCVYFVHSLHMLCIYFAYGTCILVYVVHILLSCILLVAPVPSPHTPPRTPTPTPRFLNKIFLHCTFGILIQAWIAWILKLQSKEDRRSLGRSYQIIDLSWYINFLFRIFYGFCVFLEQKIVK